MRQVLLAVVERGCGRVGGVGQQVRGVKWTAISEDAVVVVLHALLVKACLDLEQALLKDVVLHPINQLPATCRERWE